MSTLLEDGYRTAARLTREHGTTYYWGALLLPPPQRRDVHAVYALCRLADDIVDEPDKTPHPSVPAHGTRRSVSTRSAPGSSRHWPAAPQTNR